MFKKNSMRRLFIVICFVVYCTALFIIPVTTLLRSYQNPVVSKGRANLHGIDFKQEVAVYLNGEWEYYDNRLIVSENNGKAVPDGFISVPHAIPKSSREYAAGNLKKATYRITLFNCVPHEGITLSIENLPAAYRVYLNGVEFMYSGHIPQQNDNDNIRIYPFLVRNNALWLQEGENELVVEVMGRSRQGLSITPVLRGGPYNMRVYTSRTFANSMLVVACILLVLLYGAELMLRTHTGYVATTFGASLFCFIRCLARGETYTFFFPINFFLPFDQIQPVIFISAALSIYWILLSLKKMLQIKVSLASKLLVGSYLVLATVASLFMGSNFFPLYSWFLLDVFLLPVVIFLFIQFYRAAGQEKTYVTLYSMGATAMLLGYLFDNLTMSGLTHRTDTYFSLFALLFFLFTIRYIDMKKMKQIQKQALYVYQMESELKQSRLDAALHQIKPHFLYNTLLAIKTLCRRAPDKAEQAIYNFSIYLREHVDCLEKDCVIPFGASVRELQAYTDIEKMRFEDRLTIVYDIQFSDFYIPPLVLQPLMENAISHGICKRPQGGTVTLQTVSEGDFAVITIQDDGVGYHADAPDIEGIGISNVRYRLKHLINATLTISSQIGKGTVQIIRIPISKETETKHENERDYSG